MVNKSTCSAISKTRPLWQPVQSLGKKTFFKNPKLVDRFYNKLVCGSPGYSTQTFTERRNIALASVRL